MWSKASLTVMVFFRSTYSMVIMLPAESGGYLKNWLIKLLSSSFAFSKIFFTIFAGTSSIISIISSKNNSSIISFNSLSVTTPIKSLCCSTEKWANTSTAKSLGNILNINKDVWISKGSNSSATSASFISSSSFFNVTYFFSWIKYSSLLSSIFTPL